MGSHAVDNQSVGILDRFRIHGSNVRSWFLSDVRSSSRVSVDIESSVALLFLYAALGFSVGNLVL